MGQFAKLAQDEVRDKKKMMKKEQQERAKEETNKVEWIMKLGRINRSILCSGLLHPGCQGDPLLGSGGRIPR